MSIVSVEELIKAGVHFGHPVSSWNPKMAPYIFGKRNFIHIIDIKSTVKGLVQAYHFLKNMARQGKEILIVGTKRQAKQIVEEMAKDLQCPYVNERWLGGMLTNHATIRQRLGRLMEIENMEETGLISSFSKKMISSLLREKRKIKRNLDGVRNMTGLPGALVIVDPKREYIAVREALKLDIPVVAIIDTDSDPDLIDIPIPGNDDAFRSITILLGVLGKAIRAGKEEYRTQQIVEEKEEIQEEKAEEKASEKEEEKTKAKKASSPKKESEGGSKKTKKRVKVKSVITKKRKTKDQNTEPSASSEDQPKKEAEKTTTPAATEEGLSPE